MVKAIVGANWGDEGKGKITDMLACFNRIKQQHYTAVCACKVGLPAFNRIRTPLTHSVRNLIKKRSNIFII